MKLLDLNSLDSKDRCHAHKKGEESDTFTPLQILYNGFIYPYELKKCCKKYKKGKRCKKCPNN